MVVVSLSVMSDSFDPMDSSLPGSSVRLVVQARVPEWVAISFSRGSSQLRNRTQVSCIADRFFTNWATTRIFRKIQKHIRSTFTLNFLPNLSPFHIAMLYTEGLVDLF